jgi:cytochrome b561
MIDKRNHVSPQPLAETGRLPDQVRSPDQLKKGREGRATMNRQNSVNRYGWLSIGLHWLMFLLIVAVYASMELRELLPKGSHLRDAHKNWHFMLGLSIFLLVWLRLAVRASFPSPQIYPDPPAWQKLAAKIVHMALYAFMIGMPLLGWLMLSAKGRPVEFSGLQLPALVTESKSLAHLFEEIHEAVGTAGYFLIALHAAAGLFHHYFLRDNTLARMLPGRSRAGRYAMAVNRSDL